VDDATSDPRLQRWMPVTLVECLSLPLLLVVASLATAVGVLLVDSGHLGVRQFGYFAAAAAGLVAAAVIAWFAKRAYDIFDERTARRYRNAVIATVAGLGVAVCVSGLITRDRQLASIVNLGGYPLLLAARRGVLALGHKDPRRARSVCRGVTIAAAGVLVVVAALVALPIAALGSAAAAELAWLGVLAVVAGIGSVVTRGEIGR
jgi:hypothetical protein